MVPEKKEKTRVALPRVNCERFHNLYRYLSRCVTLLVIVNCVIFYQYGAFFMSFLTPPSPAFKRQICHIKHTSKGASNALTQKFSLLTPSSHDPLISKKEKYEAFAQHSSCLSLPLVHVMIYHTRRSAKFFKHFYVVFPPIRRLRVRKRGSKRRMCRWLAINIFNFSPSTTHRCRHPWTFCMNKKWHRFTSEELARREKKHRITSSYAKGASLSSSYLNDYFPTFHSSSSLLPSLPLPSARFKCRSHADKDLFSASLVPHDDNRFPEKIFLQYCVG